MSYTRIKIKFLLNFIFSFEKNLQWWDSSLVDQKAVMWKQYELAVAETESLTGDGYKYWFWRLDSTFMSQIWTVYFE